MFFSKNKINKGITIMVPSPVILIVHWLLPLAQVKGVGRLPSGVRGPLCSPSSVWTAMWPWLGLFPSLASPSIYRAGDLHRPSYARILWLSLIYFCLTPLPGACGSELISLAGRDPGSSGGECWANEAKVIGQLGCLWGTWLCSWTAAPLPIASLRHWWPYRE